MFVYYLTSSDNREVSLLSAATSTCDNPQTSGSSVKRPWRHKEQICQRAIGNDVRSTHGEMLRHYTDDMKAYG